MAMCIPAMCCGCPGSGLALISWEEAQPADTRLDLGLARNAAGRAARAAVEMEAWWRAEPERAWVMALRLRLVRWQSILRSTPWP